jgi:N-acetylglucosamine kinase-like BadF-type ATPase
MKLIADSGSTKTHWYIKETNKHIFTKGYNPYFESTEEIKHSINLELLPQIEKEKIQEIEFYGAGCSAEKKHIVENALKEIFSATKIIVESDLLGAARALSNDEESIVCILGTGSNSCLFDGKKIVKNISPGGFILGDEGSGAVLGKLFISDLLKNQIEPELTDLFRNEYPELSTPSIIDAVYRKPFPNRFLAQFSKFIHTHRNHTYCKTLLHNHFSAFFSRCITQYNRNDLPIHFVGSIAYYFKEELLESAQKYGYQIKKIQKDPIC